VQAPTLSSDITDNPIIKQERTVPDPEFDNEGESLTVDDLFNASSVEELI